MLLHGRPAEPWTIDALTAEVHLSRATLARRFTEQVGEPPLTYLTRSRTHLAARRLKDTTEPVEAIARSVGPHVRLQPRVEPRSRSTAGPYRRAA